MLLLIILNSTVYFYVKEVISIAHNKNLIDKSKRVNNLDGVFITAKVMGQIIGVTDRQVRNLANDGMIPRLSNGSYELIPALSSYIENLKLNNKEEKAEVRKEEGYQKEKFLHEKAKRQKAELQLGQMRGELHRSDVVKQVMTDMLGNFRARLLSMPTKAAPILIGRGEIAVIEDILKDEVYTILNELKDYDPESFIDDSYIELDEDEQSLLESGEEIE